MDPIIASGLFTVGKAFADRIMPGSANIINQSGFSNSNVDFSNVLNSTINNITNTQSVGSTQKLEMMQSELKSLYKSFLGNTDIPLNFRPQSGSNLITISLEKGNRIFLTNESGQKMELVAGGESFNTVEEMFNLKNMINDTKGVVKTSTLHLTGNSIY